MLEIKCEVCPRTLKRSGGLVFSPPDKEGKTEKHHICIRCYGILDEWFKREEKEKRDTGLSHEAKVA